MFTHKQQLNVLCHAGSHTWGQKDIKQTLCEKPNLIIVRIICSKGVHILAKPLIIPVSFLSFKLAPLMYCKHGAMLNNRPRLLSIC